MKPFLFACALLVPSVALGQSQTEPASLDQAGLEVPDGLFENGDRSREILAVQILLDRSRHSPGVVDGYMGGNTRRAISAYRSANGLPSSGEVDAELRSSLEKKHGGDLFRAYTITKDDVDGPFVGVPSDFAAMAELDRLAYETPVELLAEKFHMGEGLLKALNPGADFSKEGTKIIVAATGDEKLEAPVTKVVIDKAKSSVRAYAKDGTLLATYPATIGSDAFPSPSGSMKVLAVAADPTYHFDPEGRSWGPDKKLTIAAGPNGPVGGTWIDLSKEGYGIHGSPEPRLINKQTSHGCVRLTNWDAEELAGAVSEGTEVTFE